MAALSELRPRVVALGLALLSVSLYAGTLRFGFPLDDEVHVVRSLEVRDLGRSLGALAAPTWPGNLYRPLATVSYGLTYAVFGLDRVAYHATNVALNAGVAVLVYLCLLRLVGPSLALWAALLFALHPLHVEVVASIANRTELLASLAGLGAIALLLPARPDAPGAGAPRIAGAVSLLLLALLAKESALVFVPLAVLCLWWLRSSGWAALRRDVPALLGLCLAIALYLGLRVLALGAVVPAEAEISPIDNPLVELPAGERTFRAVLLLGKYVALLVAPVSPSADYSLGTLGLSADPLSLESVLYGALVLAVVTTAVVGLARRHPLGLFAAWFLAAFAVTANLAFPIGTVFADRLAYLPGLGICGLVAWGLLQIRSVPLRVVAGAALTLVFTLRTLSYAEAWRDTDAVFGYEIATSPESVKVQNGWAESLSRAGRLDEASRHFQRALAIYPGYTGAAMGLGVIALKRGDRGEAERWLARALEIDPVHVPTLVLLGRMALGQGRVDHAGKLFSRALSADNASFDARLGLLAASLAIDDLEAAGALQAALLELDPENPELLVLRHDLEGRLATRGRESRGAPGVEKAASTTPAGEDRSEVAEGDPRPGRGGARRSRQHVRS